MIQLTIDGINLTVPIGTTLVDAARQAGIIIPMLCRYQSEEGRCFQPSSCQVCLVRVDGKFVPACSTEVQDGMIVESETDDIHTLRRTALELLLSDHQGDCFAPCQLACPLKLDIPTILRFVQNGDFKSAVKTVWNKTILPSSLERICSRPCEKRCRHGKITESVSICQLIRYVTDTVLGDTNDGIDTIPVVTGTRKNIAILGAGVSGLSCAWYLTQKGYQVTLFEQDVLSAGGRLKNVSEDLLPPDVLEVEITHLLEQAIPNAIDLRLNSKVDLSDSEQYQELLKYYDAIILAFGVEGSSELRKTGFKGLDLEEKGIKINSRTFQTSNVKIFAMGTAVRNTCSEQESAAEGRIVAKQTDLFLSRKTELGDSLNIRVEITDPDIGIFKEYERYAAKEKRQEPIDIGMADFSAVEAGNQAGRCFHCECQKREKCHLLREAKNLGVQVDRYMGGDYGTEFEIIRSGDIQYEPGKCIHCGLCIQITREKGEKYGMASIGNGFKIKTVVPFGHSLEEGLSTIADECIQACPTGALTRISKN